MRMILRLCNIDGCSASFPQHYNHLVQAAIYKNISPTFSRFLHERGFVYGKRTFKMFTFSRLLGRHKKENGILRFEGDITLYISSPIDRFVKDFANFLVKRGFFKIGVNIFNIVEVKFPEEPKISREVKIKTLSPITVYSTLLTQDGRRKTYYYSPYEEEFSKLVSENLRKKFYILTKRNIKSNLDVIPLNVRECVVMFKDTIIRGWHGKFIIKGSTSLIKTAYETGLGAKNSEGFGMFEVI